MAEDFDVRDEFKAGGLQFQIGKAYVIVARKNGKIIAARQIFNWFHMTNLIDKLQKDALYRKEFLELYSIQNKKEVKTSK